MGTSQARTVGSSRVVETYDKTNYFLGGNKYRTVSFTNNTAADFELKAGRTLALDQSTDKAAIIWEREGTGDERQLAGINASLTQTIPTTETVSINMCIRGRIESIIIEPQTDVPYINSANHNLEIVTTEEMTYPISTP